MDLHNFRRHLELLRLHGFETVTVADLVLHPAPQRKRAALAFDDGLLDNYTHALPLLLEYGCRATFYVVPGYDSVTRWVQPRSGRWSDVPRAGYTLPFPSMSPAQRSELVSYGMEIGSHSYTHRKLGRVPVADLAHETRDSKLRLEDELGREVCTFCYPYGSFNRAVLRAVQEAGYQAACSTIPGYFSSSPSRFWLRRFLVESPAYFEAVLTGRAFSPKALAPLFFRHAAQWIRALFTAAADIASGPNHIVPSVDPIPEARRTEPPSHG